MTKGITAILALTCLWSSSLIAKPLVVGTWNVEHLAAVNGQGCKPRTTSDYLALQRYADSLGADVIALQEVQNKEAIQRVFKPQEYDVFISERPSTGSYECRGNGNQSTEQKVGWAVKKGTKYNYMTEKNIKSLSINGFQRYGLVLYLPEENTYLVNLHLKSKCFDNKLPSYNSDCIVKEVQVQRLVKWLGSVNGSKTVLMGDWNRQLANKNDYIAEQFPDYKMTTEKLIGCNPSYPKPIDHILTSFDVPDAKFHPFGGDGNGVSAAGEMLSDHCAATVKLQL